MNWKTSFYKKHENKLTNKIKLKTMGDFNWAQFGGGAANTLLGTGMGLLLEGHNDRRQLEQQGKLQEQQIQGQKQMMDYSMMKQMEMWKNTNYGAQMEQIATAGLNPALLYGKGGAGATTTGSPTGNVQGATAPQGGMEVMNMMMARAQMGLIEAQTEKTKAETGAVAPTIDKTKAETLSIIQGIKNQEAQQALTEIETDIKETQWNFDKNTQRFRESIVNLTLSKIDEEIKLLMEQRKITETEAKWADRRLRAEVANTIMDTWLQQKQGAGIDQAIIESVRRVQNMIQENMRAWDRMSNENMGSQKEIYERAMQDNAFPEELKGLVPGIILGRTGTGASHTPVRGFHQRN